MDVLLGFANWKGPSKLPINIERKSKNSGRVRSKILLYNPKLMGMDLILNCSANKGDTMT